VLFFLFYFIALFFLIYPKINGIRVIKKVNPITFFMIMFFMRNHLGLPFLYFSLDSFKQLRNVDLDTLVVIAASNSVISIMFLLFTMTRFYKSWSESFDAFGGAKLPELSKIGYIASIFLVLLLYMFAVKRILDGSALLALLQTGDAGLARETRLELYTTGAYVFGIRLQYLNLIFFAFEFFALYALCLGLTYKRKFYYLLSLFLFFGITLWHLSNTSKGYISVIFFYFYIAYCFYENGRKYEYMKALKLGIPLVIFASLLAYYFMGNSELYLLYPIERFSVGNLLPHYIIFSYFDIENSLWGRSVPSWYTFGLHDQFLLAEWNWRFMNDKLNTFLAYNNPSSIVAELYANFNVLGLFLIFLFFGYVIFVSRLLSLLVYSRIQSVLFIYLTFYFSKYSVREFMTAIFDYRLVLTVFICSSLIYVLSSKKGSSYGNTSYL